MVARLEGGPDAMAAKLVSAAIIVLGFVASTMAA
jgi:hypothetical protein